MASPPRRLGLHARSPPVQQTVPQPTLRWDSAVSSPTAVKTPVKKWPPPSTVHASSPSPVIAAAKAAPTADKKVVSSGFQSARAVFEAKKSPAISPSTPPGRSRLKFPVPGATTIAKQHPAISDLSASSTSTVDSEIDQKEIEREEKTFHSEPIAATKASKVKVSSRPVEPLISVKTQDLNVAYHCDSVVVVSKNLDQVQQRQASGEDIDPYRLLAPVEAVPVLPDEVSLLYDTAAVEMQRNIKKVVRKLLNKNKVRLEEFKVNARLFGTDFLDAPAYLDELINDFGAIRALQLVPCLLSIQPDVLKSNALLLTAKNYLLRNEAEIERQCHALRTTNVKETPTTMADPIVNLVAKSAAAPSSKALSPKVQSAPTIKPAGRIPIHGKVAKPDSLASNKHSIANHGLGSISFQPAVTSGQERESIKTVPKKVELPIKAATMTQEPMPEPHEVTRHEPTPCVATNIASVRDEVIIPTLPVKVITPYPALKARVESLTPSDSGEEEDFRAENLFGEPIKSSPQKKKPELSGTKLAVAPTSPATSTHSFDDAESLFGERLSTSSASSASRRKTVTWGETQSVEIRSPPKRKAPLAPLIFGPATEAAFDSDSDESDFSD